jgi:hypothetical protein
VIRRFCNFVSRILRPARPCLYMILHPQFLPRAWVLYNTPRIGQHTMDRLIKLRSRSTLVYISGCYLPRLFRADDLFGRTARARPVGISWPSLCPLEPRRRSPIQPYIQRERNGCPSM